MKHLSIAIIILAFLNSCQQSRKVDEIKPPPRYVKVDTTDGRQYITVITEPNQPKKLSLSQDEVKGINEILFSCINTYNEVQQVRFQRLKVEEPNTTTKLNDLTIDLRYYRRQYIVSTNNEGDKLVLVNGFCKSWDNDYWKTNIISVDDGGKCYFYLKVNLTTNKMLYFGPSGSV